MTTNILQFSRRPATSKPTKPPKITTSELTQWDKDFAKYGDTPEYTLCAILLSASWAYQTGQFSLGDKFLAACRKHNFSHLIPLGKELGDALNEADFAIAVGGTPDQRHG